MSADTVPLPTAVGPASTVSRRRPTSMPSNTSRSAREALDERRYLVGTQATHASGLGDADLLHDLPGPDLSYSGQRLQQGGDLHLADDVISLAFFDDVAQGALGVLESVLHLSAGTPRRSGLLQGGGTLLGSQGGQSH